MGEHSHRRASGAIAIVALVGLCAPTCHADEDQETTRMENIDAGRDPWPFTTAEMMYDVQPTKPFDATAANLIQELDSVLTTRASLEEDEVWRLAGELNPYRGTREVQEAIDHWVELCWPRMQYGVPSADADLLAKAQRAYVNGDPEEATKAYNRVLRDASAHLDARNNLALTQVHIDNDLMAQIQFETLAKVTPEYTPALINLTVVYERLGQRQKARVLAARMARSHGDLAQAVYNDAWYIALDGEHKRAHGLVKPLLGRVSNPTYPNLVNLLERQLRGVQGPWYEVGVTARWGRALWPTGMWLLAAAMFGVVLIAVTVIGSYVGSYWRWAAARVAFIVSVVPCAAAWVVAWGIPQGTMWGWAVASLIACGAVSAWMSKS